MRRTRKLVLLLLAALSLLAPGCDDDSGSAGTTSTTKPVSSSTRAPSGSDLTGALTVSGATSLKDAFTTIGDDFTATNPDVDITFNFDSSSTVATQILEGAPADVYASADEANMTKLTDENLIAGEPEIFARNELVIVTKPGNPQGITGLADLADAGTISLCGEDVPCGKYAKEALDGAGVTIPETSVTRGQNVGATLTAVTEGDAVAGIVYVTDALTAGENADSVTIPADQNVIATYPIGVLEASGNADAAEAFMAYVVGDEGQAVLKEYGFLPT